MQMLQRLGALCFLVAVSQQRLLVHAESTVFNPPDEVAGSLRAAARKAHQLGGLRATVQNLMPRLEAGGRKARGALIRLIALSTEPFAKAVMMNSGLLPAAAKLMKSPSSTVDVQRLAGSLVTSLSGMPVIAESADDKSGAAGHVDIVLPRPSRLYGPDNSALALDNGVPPSQTLAGIFEQ